MPLISEPPSAPPLVARSGATCVHCGTHFQPTAQRPDFCCTGCQFVHELITKNGLGQFYDLQDGGLPPVRSLVFQKRDYTWLRDLAMQAEGAMRAPATLPLGLQGLSCLGCVWLIEKLFARHPGALAIRVDPALGRCELRWQPGEFEIVAFAQELQSFGYLLGPPGAATQPASRALTIRLGLCAALAMNAMLFTLPGYFGMEKSFQFADFFGRIAFAVSTASLLIGGSYFFRRAWNGLRQRMLHIDLPISLGLLAAYLGSVHAWMRRAEGFVYFDFVSIFVFLMLVGRWLQQQAIERNRHRLLDTHADPAPVQLADGETLLPIAAIEPQTHYSVAPGQPIPVRSKLLSPGATLSLEWINGESEPVAARSGRVVPSGAVHCGQERIELEALETWPASMLAQLTQVAPAMAHRNLAVERFIRGYILVVVTLGAIGFVAWWQSTGDFLTALQVLISVLVVSCPCASGIALPMADDLAATALRDGGVFVRESSLWARLARVKKILFDKTGTLTLETTALRHPEALDALTPDEKGVLLALVQESLHPASCCLRELLLAEGISPAAITELRETVGFGLECRAAGAIWRLGRLAWSAAIAATEVTAGECSFSCEGAVRATFSFCDEVRADAVDEVAALRARGCEVFILSGDRRAKVEAMAAHLHLPEGCCRAEMTPQEKADWVRALDAQDTLFMGDGANDSLAFDAAYCTGTPAVDRGLLERKADFYFLGRGLAGVRQLFDAAARRRRSIRRVLAFTVAYNLVVIGVSLAGRMSPLAAAILMPASSLVSLAIVFAGRAGGGVKVESESGE